ncbi:hypothetical protein C8J57DRAFT_1457409 [Mycena rebaudengoi]|nr:hypothetical protein C8J57DRAFT_1457409 [Mycena rebaudengoi]
MATDPTPTPKPKRSSVQSNIWAFNLRSTTTNLDSDSDDSAEDTTADISEETRLLNDLDLSSREEPGVLYKPNPFSIAKINAASRPTRPAQPLTVRRPAKPVQKKPQGRIVDSFKKTVEKKLATPATVPAPVPRTTPAPSVVIPPTSDISKDMRQEVVVESLSTDAQNTTPPEEKLIAAVEHSSAHISTIPSAALSQPNHSNKRFRAPAQIPFSSPLPPPLKSRNAAILNQSSFSSPLRAPHYLGRSAPPLEPFMSNNRVAQYPHRIPPGSSCSDFPQSFKSPYTCF